MSKVKRSKRSARKSGGNKAKAKAVRANRNDAKKSIEIEEIVSVEVEQTAEKKGKRLKKSDKKKVDNLKGIKKGNSAQKPKRNIFERIYRILCYIGLKVQIKTYNPRRKFKKFRRFVRIRTAYALHKSVVQPFRRFKAYVGSETREIVRELKAIPAALRSAEKHRIRKFGSLLAGTNRNHREFFSGVRNITLPIICLIIFACVAVNISTTTYALEVSCNGKVLGYISDESVYNDAVLLLRQRVLSSSEDYQSSLTPSYSMVQVSQGLQMDSETLCELLLSDSEDVESAYGLYIDGELCAATKSYGDIQFIMQTFLEKYSTGAEDEVVSFVGKTEIVSGLFSTDMIVSSEDFAETISTQRTTTQLYTVVEGDTAQSIANAHDMEYDRLMELNEGLTDEPEAGSTIILEKVLPVLSVQTVRVETVTETIEYSTVTVQDSSKYKGYSECTTEGKNGKRSVTRQVTEINGVQTDVEELYSEIIEEAVDEVYTVGTKVKTGVGTGTFTWPLPGVKTISSSYGYRWGKLHKGVDISTSGVYGRTVVAADSGTVTAVINSSTGYGLHILISHGNGYVTCYAHLSAVSVSVGDKVVKGESIGKVGNSGSSTGPHLHFEIRKNGTAVNPMSYF